MAGVQRAKRETERKAENRAEGRWPDVGDPLAQLFGGEQRHRDNEITMSSDEHLHQLWMVLGLDDE